MDPAVLLGTLFRLAGADVSIFPNAGPFSSAGAASFSIGRSDASE